MSLEIETVEKYTAVPDGYHWGALLATERGTTARYLVRDADGEHITCVEGGGTAPSISLAAVEREFEAAIAERAEIAAYKSGQRSAR